MLPGFFKKVWLAGMTTSIVSVLLAIASQFYFGHLFRTHLGMHGLPDKRMSIDEIVDWQLYVLHAGCEICFVGATFAVVGGTAFLLDKLGRK